jgi:phenylacetate-CoA ligase
VTSPNPVYPLVRFGTGDLSRFHPNPCTCGRTTPRLVGFLGRVGEGVKVRGMFVHPLQLGQALRGRPDVARFQARVAADDHRDRITVWIEPVRGSAPDPQELACAIQAAINVRPEVVPVPIGTIPEGAPSIVDERQLERA